MTRCHQLTGLLVLGLFALLPAVGLAEDGVKKPVTLDDVLLELKLLRQVNESQIRPLFEEVAALRQRIVALEQKIDAMQKAQVRTSFAPPQSGTLRLENRLSTPVVFSINDVGYRVQPFQKLDLPSQPAGTFTYEVLVDGLYPPLQARVARTLLPNQVYTIFTFQP